MILLSSFSLPAQAGVFDLSGSYSYSQSNFGEGNIQWTRRWCGSVGYYFFALSEIELAAQDILYQTTNPGLETGIYHDRVYSVDWVQSLLPKSYTIQPYFKAGIGELVRNSSGTYLGMPWQTDYTSITGVLGAGVRIHLLRNFSLKFEGTTYLTNGLISTWQDNFYINAGFSIYL